MSNKPNGVDQPIKVIFSCCTTIIFSGNYSNTHFKFHWLVYSVRLSLLAAVDGEGEEHYSTPQLKVIYLLLIVQCNYKNNFILLVYFAYVAGNCASTESTDEFAI